MNSIHHHGEQFVKRCAPVDVIEMDDLWPSWPPFVLDRRELLTVENIIKWYYSRVDFLWLNCLKYKYPHLKIMYERGYNKYMTRHPVRKRVRNYWIKSKLCPFIFTYLVHITTVYNIDINNI